jgi:hypothetical protein
MFLLAGPVGLLGLGLRGSHGCGERHVMDRSVAPLGGGTNGASSLDLALGVHQILPSQYYDVSGGHRLSGEQRLMLALLADALNVYQHGATSRATRKRMLYLDAERWIMGQNNHGALSFETACEALSINHIVLRQRMITWKYQTMHGGLEPQTHHLRLKITPRPHRMSHRRRRPQKRLSLLIDVQSAG